MVNIKTRRRIGSYIDFLFSWAFIIIFSVFILGLIYGLIAGNLNPFAWIIRGVLLAAIISVISVELDLF